VHLLKEHLKFTLTLTLRILFKNKPKSRGLQRPLSSQSIKVPSEPSLSEEIRVKTHITLKIKDNEPKTS
jgi:hypothetical protein